VTDVTVPTVTAAMLGGIDLLITAGTLVPSSVNGDIAIHWEWSNFDPSQNPNP